MKRMSTRVAATAFGLPLVAAAATAIWIGGLQRDAGVMAQRLSAGERARIGQLAVPFIKNSGQLDSRVAFYAPTFAGTAFITHGGALVLSLPPRSGGKQGGWTLVENPADARVPHMRGVQPTAARINVFQGADRSHWRHGLRTYAQVSLGEVWKGVDYAVRAHGDNVQRLFTLQPGGDASAIRMQVRGVSALRVNHGRLVAETGRGAVTLSRPRAWQVVNHRRQAVEVHYEVEGDRYGFRLGAYDHRRPVLIDPVIRTTYVGGSGSSGSVSGAAMQLLASNGNVYIAGTTTSTVFPGTAGGAQPTLGGNRDAFVAELNSNLTQLLQATYLGGSNDDSAAALAIAPSGTPMAGDVYVAGTTRSTDFPGTSGGAQTQCAGGSSGCPNTGDAFVAAFSPDLSTLIQASYLGGTGVDEGHGLAIAPASATSSGAVYVTGRTLSTDFPQVAGGAQPSSATSNYEGFVARFNPALTSISQASYFGGSGVNEAYAIAVPPAPSTSGDVYIAGDTSSTDLPCANAGGPPPSGGACASVAGSGAQSSLAGGFDAFVAEFGPGLQQLRQSTYLGGSDIDGASTLAVAPASSSEAGQVFVGGLTYSDDLTGTANGAQPQNGGGVDGFVARFSSNLQTLGQTTYVGGSADDNANALAFSGSNVYVAGTTSSSDFPCTGAGGTPAPSGGGSCSQQSPGIQYRYGGGNTDGFVSLFNANLQSMAQSTYMGGSKDDDLVGLSLAPAASTYAGDVYVGGSTDSANLPATAGAAEPAFTGSQAAFAAVLSPDLKGRQVKLDLATSGPSSATVGKPFKMTITATNDSAAGDAATNVTVVDTINSVTGTGSGTIGYKASTTSQGSCTDTFQVLTCNIGTLPGNGGSAQMTVTLNGTSSGTIKSSVVVSADQALDSTSASQVYYTTKLSSSGSSSGGGGGAFGWPALSLLAVLALLLPLRARPRLRPVRQRKRQDRIDSGS